MSRKVSTMTADMIRACAVRCTIKLPHGKDGRCVVTADSGDYFAYPAKCEVMRKFRKMAIKDRTARECGTKPNTDQYHGEFGRVQIGGKMFTLYPYSGMLVRDDFAMWCESHFDEVWDDKNHCERLAKKDTSGKGVPDGSIRDDFSSARRLAMKMPTVTDLLEPGTYNSVYDMKKTMATYKLAIDAADDQGQFFIGTHILSSMLAATIAFREKKFADAIGFAHNLSALGLKMADFFREQAKEAK